MPDEPYAPQNPTPSPNPLVTPPGTPLGTGPTSTGLAPNVAAGIAVFFSFVSGIVFLIIEKRSTFVRFWAMQSTIYGFLWLAVRIVVEIMVRIFLSMSAFSTALFFARVWEFFNYAFLVGVIVMLYFAFTGKEWELPVLGKVARQGLIKFPPKP